MDRTFKHANLRNWDGHAIYEAIQPLECGVTTEHTIQPGERFTRQYIKYNGYNILNVCPQCLAIRPLKSRW